MPHNCCSYSVAEIFGTNTDEKPKNLFTLSEDAAPKYAPDLKLEPKHIDIHLLFKENSLTDHEFNVKVVQHILCNQPSNKISLNAESFEDVNVKDLSSDDNKISHRYDGKYIHLVWDEPLSKGELRKVEITYKVDNPVSSICWNYANNSSRVGDFAVTDEESERCRYWLACVDFPTVRTTLTTHITAPKSWSSFGQGPLKSTKEEGENVTRTFDLEFPCPSYLICWAVGDLIMVKEERDTAGVPVAYIAPRGVPEEDLKLTFNKTPEIIKWLEKRVGVKFPFSRYYIIITPKNYGAMENITLVTFDFLFLMNKDITKEFQQLTDMINLHECAHSYFGDAVVIRHFEHVWLKEGWATYMQACWFGETISQDEMLYELYNHSQRYMGEVNDAYSRPIVTRTYDSSWDLFDRHTYPGGSWRLHMLRHKLGEDQFWTGVSNYIKNNLRGIVETDDFRKELEKASGQNLVKFFDQWLYSNGYPKIKLSHKINDKSNTVEFTATQNQLNKETNTPNFEFDLTIHVTFDNQQTECSALHFDQKESSCSVSIPNGAKLHSVTIDRECQVLFSIEYDPGQDILQNTFLDTTLFNKIQCADTLIKNYKKSSIQFLVKHYEKQHWGVRLEVFKLLAAQKGNSWCRDALIQLLPLEKHYHTLHQNISRLYRDAKFVPVLLQLYKECVTPLVRSQLLWAMSLQKMSSDDLMEMIKSSIEADHSLYAVTRMGAYRAARNIESVSTLDWLTESITNETFGECKPVIIESIAHLGGCLDDNIKRKSILLLEELLRSDEEQERRAAVMGLVALKSKSSGAAIASTRNTFADQYHSWLDRSMRQLTSTSNDEFHKVNKDISELRDLIRDASQLNESS
ncbi:aminopeptidase [Acrasis kona]|uniref:Aminopeptidase n=1 Tax=Acrasis kona TaxID=1008807 RepID=A0AAW2ZRP4_9EUKA